MATKGLQPNLSIGRFAVTLQPHSSSVPMALEQRVRVPSSFLEIVELPNGDIVLLRADGEGDPLVNIRFSDESKSYMPEARLEIARAMIQAGIETAVMLSENDENSDTDLRATFIDEEDDNSEPRVLH